jgi:hypothetical protein
LFDHDENAGSKNSVGSTVGTRTQSPAASCLLPRTLNQPVLLQFLA